MKSKFSPPATITSHSDGNEMQFKFIRGKFYYYEYTLSNTKKGQLVWFTEELLEKFIEQNNSTTKQKFQRYETGSSNL